MLRLRNLQSKPGPNATLTDFTNAPRGGLWLPGDGAATVPDIARRNSAGVYTGGTAPIQGPFGGRALNLDGATGYIDLGVGPAIANLAVSPATVICWYKISGGGSATVFYKSDNNGSQGFFVYVLAGAITVKFVRATTDFTWTQTAGPSFAPGGYCMLAATWDGSLTSGSVNAYANGVPVSASSTTVGSGASNDDTTQHLTIGKSGSGSTGGQMSGAVDQILIDRRIWSAGEIADLYRNPFGMFQRRLFIPAGASAGAVYTWQWL